jgi:hypothetical protein
MAEEEWVMTNPPESELVDTENCVRTAGVIDSGE